MKTFADVAEYYTRVFTTNVTPPVSDGRHSEALAAAAGAYAPVYVSMDMASPVDLGYEAIGAQPADAEPDTTPASFLEQALIRVKNEMQGATVAHAITALHNQHSRDGRPSRFMPEGA